LTMNKYVIDTHPLIWYFSRPSNLSETAYEITEHTELGKNIIFITIIVLSELLHISERNRITINLDQILEIIHESENFIISNYDYPIFMSMKRLQGLEMHDRIIAATSILKESPLITKDSMLTSRHEINTIW
jgi:PIN domain nuclease of toxin-antitoxin system